MTLTPDQIVDTIKSLINEIMVPALKEDQRYRIAELRKELLDEIDPRVDRAVKKAVKNAVDDKLYQGQQKLAETLNRVVTELVK